MRFPPLIRDWPEYARVEFEERAGIKEFQANKPREVAEQEAEEEVRAQYGQPTQRALQLGDGKHG